MRAEHRSRERKLVDAAAASAGPAVVRVGAPTWWLAAFGLPLLAFALEHAFWPQLAAEACLLSYPIVFVAPRLGGTSGGVIATSLSASLAWWGFVPERGALSRGHPPLPAVLGLLFVGFAFVWLHARVRRAGHSARLSLGSSRESALHQDQLLDAAADPVAIIDGEGAFEYVNASLEKTFGYASGELLGRSHQLLVPERHRQAPAADWNALAREPEPHRLPRVGRRKDGSELPIELTLNPIQTPRGTLVWAALRDLSHERELEAGARVQADRLTGALESIDDPFWILDREGKLVACNSAFHRLWQSVGRRFELGTPRAEIIPHLSALIAFKDEAEQAAFVARRQAARSRLRDSYDITFNDGRTFRVTRGPTPEGGEVTLAFDLTQELRRKRELEAARAEAEHASRVKTEFLSSMSHELRTPLNAVLGFGQLLKKDREKRLSEAQQEMVGYILSSGAHLLSLIDDVLDLSRLEVQGLTGETESVDLQAVVQEVVSTLRPAAMTTGIELSVVGGAGARVNANRRRVLQLLLNLGSNAVKYNRQAGTVTFTISTAAGCARVTVTDTGIGVPVEERDKLFQPFHRAGQERGPIAGTGIGLAISKRLAELMGGSVGYRNLSEGSEFWLELPECVSPPAPPATNASPLDPQPSEPNQRGVVLYIEDNPVNLALMRRALATYPGVELISATSAEEGLDAISRRRPALVLMDLNLPGMSGAEALERLRAAPETARIPVVAVTATAGPGAREQGLGAGFQHYLTKPVDLDALESLVARYLSTATEPAPAAPTRLAAVERDR